MQWFKSGVNWKRCSMWCCAFVHSKIKFHSLHLPSRTEAHRKQQISMLSQSTLISIVFIGYAFSCVLLLSFFRTATTAVILNILMIVNSGIPPYLYIAFSSELRTRCASVLMNKMYSSVSSGGIGSSSGNASSALWKWSFPSRYFFHFDPEIFDRIRTIPTNPSIHMLFHFGQLHLVCSCRWQNLIILAIHLEDPKSDLRVWILRCHW